jgi:hypothetical protein
MFYAARSAPTQPAHVSVILERFAKNRQSGVPGVDAQLEEERSQRGKGDSGAASVARQTRPFTICLGDIL